MRDLVEPRSWPKYGSPDDKRSRTFMTTSGMKTFRLQPTANNSTLSKYQIRSERTPSPSPLQPLAHSTPVPHHIESSQIIRSSSSKLERNYSKSLKNSRKTPPLGSSRSTPSPVISASNPESRHTTTFTVRSANCTPTHLYMAEHVRAEAKLRHEAARPHSCSRQNVKRNKTPDDYEIPDRFGEPITLPTFVKSNPHLKHSQLSMGQKQYLWGIARIYSVDRLKKLKQRQYQGLLDYEFKKRLEKMDLKGRERVKEVKDYLRYTKFINTYEKRIPRNLRSSDSPCEVTVANHIHKHVVKGWTTNVDELARYREGTLGDSQETLELVDSNVVDVVKSERGRHIYKHVIKGWTMDPRANDAYQLNNAAASGDEEEGDERREISLSAPENTLEDDVSIYRVEISKSTVKNHEDEGEVMRITGINGEVAEISVSLQDSTITDSNFL